MMSTLMLHCKPLDTLLKGGIEKSSIIEIYGEAGTGKTNICLQAARECALSDGKVAYIATEGVSGERLTQIIQDIRAQEILENILFFTPFSLTEQEQSIHAAVTMNDVEMIVVDTINKLFRFQFQKDQEDASRSFTRQITDLQLAAKKRNLYVILTGQVYTADDGDVKPFAGRGIERMIQTIMKLEKTGKGWRQATLMKHRSQPVGSKVYFRITEKGLE